MPSGNGRGRGRRPFVAGCAAHARAHALSLRVSQVRTCTRGSDTPLHAVTVQVAVCAEGVPRRRGRLPRLRGTGALADIRAFVPDTHSCVGRHSSGMTPRMPSTPARGGVQGSLRLLPAAVAQSALTPRTLPSPRASPFAQNTSMLEYYICTFEVMSPHHRFL